MADTTEAPGRRPEEPSAPYRDGVPARNPLVLAALASVAVPGLVPVTAQAAPPGAPASGGTTPGGRGTAQGEPAEDVDAALVTDDQGRRWVVRAPRTSAAAALLEQEWRFLGTLTGRLPFAVPLVAGTAWLPEGGRAGVHRALEGSPIVPASMAAGAGLSATLGRALAAIHELPSRFAEDAELPVYTADEYRRRRLAELDRAAATGHVPAALLARWERALEEAGAWRFTPCVVHGDLAAENVLVQGSSVKSVLAWGQARIADPADDLAWLVAAAPATATDSVLGAYAHTRRDAPDHGLVRRARLGGELALARWLLHGVTSGDDAVVADAVGMLGDLEAAVGDDPW
ncbi:MAG TPA: phosphotransferase [Kineosporiaceae bacterium]|nr:phosphotransferase [Kineosporiaceae bacterium]